ncbi:MAG: hypothetical protein K1X55_03350 [Chitinophagales bacterium]|nr:hypothetical protein [Chitinophagales bacterium]
MRKSLVILTFFCLISSEIFSQVPGHLGKRFFIMSDLTASYLDRGANVSVEYLLFKGASLRFDYRFLNKPSEVYNFNTGATSKFTIHENRFGVGLKKFWRKSIVNPPLGGYTEFTYHFGFANFNANNIEYNKVPFRNWKLGGGYQYIFKRWLMLDIGIFLDQTNIPVNSEYGWFNFGRYSANLFAGKSNNTPSTGFSLRTGIGFLIF